MTTPTIQKALDAAYGTQTGCMLRCAANRNEDSDYPRFTTKATITSDGFIMAGFIDTMCNHRGSSLAGHWDDLQANLSVLADHCEFDAAQRKELMDLMNSWIADDWRTPKRSFA